MSNDVYGLFDPPGPRARRRIVVATVLSLLLGAAALALALEQFADHGQLDAEKWVIFADPAVIRYLGNGLLSTIQATVVSAAVAIPLGLLAGMARMARWKGIRIVAGTYIEVFRAMPLLLLLFVFLIALPRFGLTLPIFWQLVIPIIISNIAVIAEIFRAGVLSLSRGQSEAAACIGLSYWQSMRLVLIPQALRTIMPALVGQLVRLLKESTLGYVVSFLELLYAGRVLGEYTHSLLQTYLVVAVVFIMINAALAQLALWLQRRQGGQRRPSGRRSPERRQPTTVPARTAESVGAPV